MPKAEMVAWIRMDRAEAPGEWLPAALEAIREAGEARVVVLEAPEGALQGAEPLSEAELRALTLFELPVVCCFEGQLDSGMARIALAADIRVCGADGALALQPGEVPMDANALLAAGLVTAVRPAGEAAEEARRLADVIASRGPIATRLAKEAIKRGAHQPLEQALRFETDLTLLLQTTKDRAEGVRAFLEKRPPMFTGE